MNSGSILSDRYTAEYLVGLARKAPSMDTFIKQLEKIGAISVNEAVTEVKFLEPEREAILQREKNKKYQMAQSQMKKII